MRLVFTVPGAPRQKKNAGSVVFVGTKCRGCNRGRYPKILPAAPWIAWSRYALPQRRSWAPGETVVEPVNCSAIFYTDTRRKVDAHNLYEGLADLLQAARVVEDDSLIVSWDGSRVDLDRENPRTEVVLESVEEVGR